MTPLESAARRSPMTPDLFDDAAAPDSSDVAALPQALADGAVVLQRYATLFQKAVIEDLQSVIATAPLRHLITPGGLRMSVAMTNCGALGWVSDRTGYRYDALDPD